jgi:hypothetical protein
MSPAAERDAMTRDEPAGGGIRLHTFGGQPPPQAVTDGWSRLTELPAPARDALWGLLAPALLEPSRPGIQEALDAYCGQHEVSEEAVLAAVHACELLFRQVGALDLDRERFEEDLHALSGDRSEAAGVLLSEFTWAKGELRKRLLRRSLAEHGNVLLGIDWRVDRVLRSNHGEELNASVVLLTLRYREGEERRRITLQLSPGALKDLKGFTSQFGG